MGRITKKLNGQEANKLLASQQMKMNGLRKKLSHEQREEIKDYATCYTARESFSGHNISLFGDHDWPPRHLI